MTDMTDLLKKIISVLPDEAKEDLIKKMKAQIEQAMSPPEVCLMYASSSAAAFRVLQGLDAGDPRQQVAGTLLCESLSDLGDWLEKQDATRENFQDSIPRMRTFATDFVVRHKAPENA